MYFFGTPISFFGVIPNFSLLLDPINCQSLVRLFPWIRNIVGARVSSFPFSYFTWTENQTRFIESSDSEIKKLVVNAVPESVKKSTNVNAGFN